MVLLVAAFVMPLISIKRERYVPYIAVAATLMALAMAIPTIPAVLESGMVMHQMEDWPAPAGITIAVDGIGMVAVMMVSFIGAIVSCFSFRFIKRRKMEYYSLLCLLLAGLMGIAHTGDIFNMFVFLEIVGLSSYLLTAYYKSTRSIEASIKFLIIGSFSTSMFLLGTLLLYGTTGTLNMADLAVKLAGISSPVIPICMGLLITGLGIKAVIFPFYAWKPDAVSAAPATVGAVLSSASAFIGIFAVMRILFTVFTGYGQAVYWLFIGLGMVTMLIGSLLAVHQRSLLRLLAYSAISQTGYVFVALGIGGFVPDGLNAAVFHMINIALIEALLFLSAGAVIHKTGTDDMSRISGMSGISKTLSLCFLVGVLANAGIPFLNGFASKWMIYVTALAVSPLITAFAAVISVIALMYGVRAYSVVFLGPSEHRRSRLPKSMLLPIVVLAAACIILGVAPHLGMQLAEFASGSLNNIPYIANVLS